MRPAMSSPPALGNPSNHAKEILGHARTTTTLAIYTSGDEDDQRSALDKILDLLFQESEKQ